MSLSTIDRTYLAKDAYEDRSREAAPDAEPIRVGGREYKVIAYVSKPSGYQGTAYRELPDGEVVIANRGTEFNLLSPEFLRDVVRADGGMVAKAVNVQANDAIEFAELASYKAKEWAETKGKPLPRITAVGHSLGGSHAQIQSHHLGLEAETFNSYGAAELAVMQGPPRPGARTVNHMDATDFVSAGSRHFGEQRIYATEADIAHLRQQDYGLPAYRPEVSGLASPTTGIARHFLQPDPVAAALSPHGVGAHRIATMAPNPVSAPSVLSEANRQRYEENRTLVDPYRNDIREIRLGVSAHTMEWPRAVEALGQAALHASVAMDALGAINMTMQTVRDAPIRIGQALVDEVRALARDRQAAPHHASPTPTTAPLSRDGQRLDTRTIEDSTRQFLHDAPRLHDAKREPLSYADPGHPHNSLYRELREKLPAEVSNEKVAEFTLAARVGGVQPGQVESVHVHDGKAWALGTSLFDGMIDLRTPAPPLAETMQKAETFEQQHQAQVAQWQEQRQSQSHGRSM